MIKHCLIADASKWEEIRQKNWQEQDWTDLITHSVAIKENVTTQDPTEKGLRKILNFGHTLGHAIETYFLDDSDQRLLHGEAIAAGMITEAYLSYQRGWLTTEAFETITHYLLATYGKAVIPADTYDSIIELTAQDKKNRGKEIRFSLLKGLGTCVFDIPVSSEEMQQALAFYTSLS